MHAVILVGGRGSRLLPLTERRPKPLVKLGGYSILEIIIRRLRACGFERVTLCVAHLGEMIRDEFGDGRFLGLTVDYCVDDPPSGTAGPLRLVPDWDSPAVVMNGDVLTALDFAYFLGMHEQSASPLSVAFQRKEIPVDMGLLRIVDQRVEAVWEKPTLAIDVSSGMYVLDPSVREYIPSGVQVDMPDVIQTLLARGESVNAHGFGEEWFDIGTPEAYIHAEQEFLANQEHYLSLGAPAGPLSFDAASIQVSSLATGTKDRPRLSVSLSR